MKRLSSFAGLLLALALPLSLAACKGGHGSIDGTYGKDSAFGAASETLELKNGIESKFGDLSMRDGAYRYCRDAGHCEDGRYHLERLSASYSSALDRISFQGGPMARTYAGGGWVDYDIWGGPMIGQGDPDSGADFHKAR